jgi:hypothetical protein
VNVKQKIKWKIILFIDRFFHKRYCWADLVFWHMSTKDFNEMEKPRQCGYCFNCFTKEEMEQVLRERG